MIVLKKWHINLPSHQGCMRGPTAPMPTLGVIHHFGLTCMIREKGICMSLRMTTKKLNVHQWAMTNNEKSTLCNITQQLKLYHEDLHILTWREIHNILLHIKKDKLMNKDSAQFLFTKGEKTMCSVAHAREYAGWFILELKGEWGRF